MEIVSVKALLYDIIPIAEIIIRSLCRALVKEFHAKLRRCGNVHDVLCDLPHILKIVAP